MRPLFRLLATICFFAALAGFGLEVSNAVEIDRYEFIPLGEVWADINANSLIGLQTGVEAAWPWLWREIVVPILLGPVWAAPLGLWFLLRLLGRRPGPKSRSRQPERVRRLLSALQNTDVAALQRQLQARVAKVTPQAPSPQVPAAPTKQGNAPVARTAPRSAAPVHRVARHSADAAGLPRRSGPTVVRRS